MQNSDYWMLSGLGPKTGVGVRWGLDWAKNQRLKGRLAAADSNQADGAKPRKIAVLCRPSMALNLFGLGLAPTAVE